MLIIEVLLTIFVWRKGWKWYALIPIISAALIGVLTGIAISSSGGTLDTPSASAFIIDLLAIIALIIMLANKPKNSKELKAYNLEKSKTAKQDA